MDGDNTGSSMPSNICQGSMGTTNQTLRTTMTMDKMAWNWRSYSTMGKARYKQQVGGQMLQWEWRAGLTDMSEV